MISVPTSIARWVSLRLNNTTANPVSPNLAHNGFSDEISGQLSRIAWQAGPRQTPNCVSEMKGGLQWNTLILSASLHHIMSAKTNLVDESIVRFFVFHSVQYQY